MNPNLPNTELKVSFSVALNINPLHTRPGPVVVVLHYHHQEPACRGAAIPQEVRPGQRHSFVEFALSTSEALSLFTFTFAVEVKVKSAAGECPRLWPDPVVVDARVVVRKTVGVGYTGHTRCNTNFREHP